MPSLDELLESSPDAFIADAFVITNAKIQRYNNIVCAISGGSDSDIMLDICTKLDSNKKITYVWFNTGLEYQATKDHLKFLEKKYGIEIEVINAVKPIPIACKIYGLPFISKRVSKLINALQRNNFKWEDRPLLDLLKEYCKTVPREKGEKNPERYFFYNGEYWRGCCSALRWWCNDFPKSDKGYDSKFNINYNKYLKEFMIANPPTDIPISEKYCEWAKKKPIHNYISENKNDLNMSGVRKSEGGARSTAYKNCFTFKDSGADEYRPIFWFLNDTKVMYENTYDVVHSVCYRDYGLTRTGCAGCPYGNDFEEELKIIEKHEPKLYKAVNNIFGKSYEYTRKYYKFRDECKAKEVNV